MFVANKTIGNQVDTTLQSIGTTITVIPNGAFQDGSGLDMNEVVKAQNIDHISQFTMSFTARAQPAGTTADISGRENVTDGGPTNLQSVRSRPPGMTVPSNFSPSISLVGASNPTDPAALGLDSLRITDGVAFDGTQDENKALLSTTMANKNNLSVGSTFMAHNETLTVTGLFDTGGERGNSSVIIPLPVAQRFGNAPGKVSGAAITVDSLENLAVTTERVRETLSAVPADIVSQLEQANNALEPLTNVQRVSMYSLGGAVIASATIILLTMIMIVRERRREIGILKAIGLSNTRIILQYICEALTFAVLSTIVGLAIGIVASGPVTQALAGSGAPSGDSKGVGAEVATRLADAPAHISWEIIAYGFGIAILIALISSALAAFFISKVRPAEVLRSE
jgi:putative ABC transport system permease protein